jgi:hypothetical protein
MSRKILIILLLLLLGVGAVTLVNAQSDAPFGIQMVRQTADLMMGAENASDPAIKLGTAEYWNTRNNFMIELQVDEGWQLVDAQVYAGLETPPLKKDKPVPGRFPCKRDFAVLKDRNMVMCSLKEELDHSWGGLKTRYVAIHADLTKVDEFGITLTTDVWAIPTTEEGLVEAYEKWPTMHWGGYFETVFVHPRRGHFIDSPVSGLTFETPTNWGVTDASGAFDYFPGETVNLAVGTVNLGESATANKISPLDIFMADADDPRVINMARLIQSLDADANPKGGIEIRPIVIGCLDMAMENLGLLETGIDWTSDGQVENVILETIANCEHR